MKICCISDTHQLTYGLERRLPAADVLVFGGDLCNGGRDLLEAQNFNHFLLSVEDRYKKIICIAGNHDFIFERQKQSAKALLVANSEKIIYLEDEEVVIDGIKFYGSPWQPEFCNWAFNVPRGEKLARIWENIPLDTDVLITHGPPYGTLDFTEYDQINVGCEMLAERLKHVKPKLHVFGHIHEAYGVEKKENTLYVNASICTLRYKPVNSPIVVRVTKSGAKRLS